nr:AAA family ATPase [uncultured Prevotella sp.]
MVSYKALNTELRKTYVNENDHIVFRNTDGRNANSQKHYVSEKKLRELYLKISENIQHFEDETKITKDKCKELNGGREVDTTAPLILKELFKRSRKGLLRLSKSSKYVFIIDEINRGELSKIFGELFYAIDPGYRGEKGKVKTQYQNLIDNDDVFVDGFFVPENVYILATMNDIDRSVESMDFALRRRFAWKEIKPEDRMEMLSEKLDHDTCVKAIRVMNALNKDISKTRGLGSAYQIGPAYFLKLDKELYNGDFTALWDMHIEILLKEYLRGYSNADAKVEELKNVYFNSLNGKTVDVAD